MPSARHAFERAAPPPSRREVLAVWHDVTPGHAAAVREWYAREHRAERLALPGCVEARRYDRVAGVGADMFGMYDVESPDAPLDASPWAPAVLPYIRNSSVTPCAVTAQAGRAEGGHLATLAAADAPRKALDCDALLALPGVLRVRALAPRRERAGLRSEPREPRLRWALLVDADSAESAQTALYAARDRAGLTGPTQCAVYRLATCARSAS